LNEWNVLRIGEEVLKEEIRRMAIGLKQYSRLQATDLLASPAQGMSADPLRHEEVNSISGYRGETIGSDTEEGILKSGDCKNQ
jgi:hypothetical protein